MVYYYYIILAVVILAGIATTAYLWWNHKRLDRQGKQLRQSAYVRFENAATQAEEHGWGVEAKLARALRDLWR